MSFTRSRPSDPSHYTYDSKLSFNSRTLLQVTGDHESESYAAWSTSMVYIPSVRLFPPESKARIRERCLTFLDETDDIVSHLPEP